MRISDATLGKLLQKAGKLKPANLEKLKTEEKRTGKRPQAFVIKNEHISEKDLTQLYAKEINIPFIELDPKNVTKKTISMLPERVARQYNAVLFGIDKSGAKQLAMEDPDDVQAVDFLQKYIGTDFQLYIATKDN